MQNSSESKITSYQLLCILTGTAIGIGLMDLPNQVTEIAKQNGWVSVIIGGIYPLYIVYIADILQNKFPDENILQLSRKFLGKVLEIYSICFLCLILYSILQPLHRV